MSVPRRVGTHSKPIYHIDGEMCTNCSMPISIAEEIQGLVRTIADERVKIVSPIHYPDALS